MEIMGKSVCPICTGENSIAAIRCKYCGHYLRSLRLAFPQARPKPDLYEIIPDGGGYAISFRGDVKVQGLETADLGRARSVLAMLNSVIGDLEDAR